MQAFRSLGSHVAMLVPHISLQCLCIPYKYIPQGYVSGVKDSCGECAGIVPLQLVVLQEILRCPTGQLTV